MTQQEQLKQWAEAWAKAGPELERIRRQEIRETDTFETVSAFLGPIDFTQEPFAPSPTSGLVEQQARFAKLRK
tara:strand:+ start:199 stop:417 length:219 start_codon:yes stop_codon:yes gene_type:complete